MFTPSDPDNVQLRPIIGDGIHIWEKAAGNHMFVLVEDPKKHFKTGNAKDFFFKKSDLIKKLRLNLS